jgi:hypothetical protein
MRRGGVRSLMRPSPAVIQVDFGRARRTNKGNRHRWRTRFGQTFLRVARVPHSDGEGHTRVRTPHRITAAEFSDSLKRFLDTCCVLCGESLCCTTCGTPILHVRAALSIHNSAAGDCGGQDERVWTTVVPYCPRCEEKPERRGCLHFTPGVFPKAS